MPDLLHIKIFTLTVELKSLAAVSRKLEISTAAISKQLTRLEKELGVQLLMRSTRKIELTDIGKSYYLQCLRILEEVDAASALISQVKAVPSGLLKVMSGRHFGAAYIVPHLKEFLTKYPQVELSLELAERIPDLQAEGIDVLIGMSMSATGEVIQKRIGKTAYVFCAAPSYLKQFGFPESVQDLKNHRCVSHTMRKLDEEFLLETDQTLIRPYLRVNDVQTMLQLALDGMGIVKLHDYVVRDYLKQGLLQPVLSHYTKQELPLYVAYPQRRFTSSKVRCFIDFFTQKINQKIHVR